MTLGQKLTGLIALAIFAVSVMAMLAQYKLVTGDLAARQQALVQSDLDGFAALYDQRRVIAVRQAIEFRKISDPGQDLFAILLDRDGVVLAATHLDWPDAAGKPLAGETLAPRAFTEGGTRYLGIARGLPGGFALMVGRNATSTEQTSAQMRRIIWMACLAIAIAALILGQIASRMILTRLNRINALADEVAAGDLSARLPGPPAADEFGKLEHHIHHMLDQIEALHRATHHLSDTVAHEMRTPLTRIQTRLARLKTDNADTEALQGEIRSTIRIFDSLLEIARAEAMTGESKGPEMLDLSILLAEVCELYEPVAETRGIRFATEIQDSAMVLGDRNLIAQLVSNLLENALKFTPTGQSVLVALTDTPDRYLMRVEDTGPGLPIGFGAQIFERFSRAGSDPNAPGHGLGMALVKAVALRHGAKLALPGVKKGFAIEIAWPKLAENQ